MSEYLWTDDIRLDGAKIEWQWDHSGATDEFGNTIYGHWVLRANPFNDVALYDQANDSGIADHFRGYSGSYPPAWTEVDAAESATTNTLYSFWYLRGSSTETSWKYRVQTGITIESLAANDWASFQFGPILLRDGDFAADVDYYFGAYRNNAGAIDETTFSRVHLWWDSGNSLWKIRGEEKDGSTEHDGAWITLDQNPLPQPFFFRVVVRNVAAKTTRQYMGTLSVGNSHQLLLSQAPSSAPTWGQVWLQIHQSRGAGVEDYLYMGAVDYLANIP